MIVGLDVDPTRGTLMPYLENNKAVLKCPNTTAKIQQKYNGGTGGYGYNYAYLAPLTYAPPTWQPVWQPTNIGAHLRRRVRPSRSPTRWARGSDSWPPAGDPILIEVPLMEPP